MASKKVMARLNAPRFMRVGDKVGISATLFNNTDAEAPVAGLIELINPATGVAVASRTSPRDSAGERFKGCDNGL